MRNRTEMNASQFGVKTSDSRLQTGWIKRLKVKVILQWNNICWNRHCTGRDIQYSASRVKLDFLVIRSVVFHSNITFAVLKINSDYVISK